MADFDDLPNHFTRKLADVKQRQPLCIVSVVVGDDTTQAETFADRVVCVDDLMADREQLRGTASELV